MLVNWKFLGRNGASDFLPHCINERPNLVQTTLTVSRPACVVADVEHQLYRFEANDGHHVSNLWVYHLHTPCLFVACGQCSYRRAWNGLPVPCTEAPKQCFRQSLGLISPINKAQQSYLLFLFLLILGACTSSASSSSLPLLQTAAVTVTYMHMAVVIGSINVSNRETGE